MSETIITLSSKKYKSEGDLSWEYNPLHNIIEDKGEDTVPHALSDFDTDDFNLDMEHPVEVEVQPSYDGSVNLIINDDHDVPRIVNSAFTVQEGWKYKRVVRDQQTQTNYYHVDKVDETTRLFRTTSTFLHVDLTDVESGGELKGGNYKFYFKYGDEDFNETDWVGESGIVSIFHGFPSHIKDVIGTLMHEKTDHQITLDLSGVDVAFSKLYVYVKRSYSDLNGVLMDEYYKIVDPYDIVSTSFAITINGFEKTTSVSQDVFNIAYNVYDAVATSAQVQNRLFFGNVKETVPNHNVLSNCALNIVVGITQENVGNVGTDYMSTSNRKSEYYNAINVYDNLGYWPGELYRFGVVFIYNNDTLSDAYNLKGCCFDSVGSDNHNKKWPENTIKTYDINDIFINGDSKYNTRGVFQMPDEDICSTGEIKPLGLKIVVPECVRTKLRELNIKGMFFVRQPRIPIVLAQALSIGVSDRANIPVLSKQENGKSVYIAETILKDNKLTRETRYSIDEDSDEVWSATCCALLCQDVNLNKSLQSLFDGTQFILKPVGKYSLTTVDLNDRLYSATKIEHIFNSETSSVKLAYIAPETASRVLEGRVFSSKAGSEAELVTLKNLRWDSDKTLSGGNRPVDEYTVRGNYTGYLGVVSGEISNNIIYNIYSSSYIGTDITKRRLQIKLRSQDSTPFTAVSQRVSLDDLINNSEQYIFGGDCFTCTTSIKMCSNFLDYNTPLNDKIVKYNIGTNSDGKNDYNSWEVNDRNLSDWNAVSIGHYVTYKCLSNFNLGLRCLDDQRTDERALFGDVRNFYPYSQHTYGVSFKIPESNLMNAGNSSTGGAIYHFAPNKVPFTKEFFDNRIAFSNIQSVDSFQNNYRVFSNLSYTDVERKYGAIVKLLPLGANLFCVFEHGCGIVPINEKALMSTTTGQSIHLYGSDVVQSQITVISPDYGSTWEESIIVTPNGIYGVDTFAKKIWRYSSEGFAVISDMLVQRFLNDNINLTDYEQNAIVASRNVKTHYNNYKGDVMFTFYNGDKEWNLCYNERIQKWVTKYSWTPAYSANIYNSFISTDKQSIQYYAEVSHKLGPLAFVGEFPELNVSESSARYKSSFWYHLQEYKPSTRRGEDGDIITDYTAQLAINGLILHIGNEKRVLDWSKIESYATIYDNYLPEEKTCTWTIPQEHGKLVKWECPKGFIVGLRNNNDIENSNNDASWITSEISGSTEVVADQLFTDWVYYTWDDSKILIKLSLSGDALSKETLIHRVDLDISYQIMQNVEKYKDAKDENSPDILLSRETVPWEKGRSVQILLLSSNNLPENLKTALEDLRCIRFYTHGRAGYHESRTQQHLLKPTCWYGKQEPFEFEFVINSNTGVQKIFDNLMIVSNNAEPDSIECTIIGDSYGFDKEKILSGSEDKLDFNVEFKVNPDENIVFKTNISKDHVLNQYTLTSCAKLRDLADIKYGRRLGNIHYVEDKWNITLDPIYYKTWSDDKTTSKTTSIKLRDKWMKVRIKYKGDKLAVISAIQSLYTVSFA